MIIKYLLLSSAPDRFDACAFPASRKHAILSSYIIRSAEFKILRPPSVRYSYSLRFQQKTKSAYSYAINYVAVTDGLEFDLTSACGYRLTTRWADRWSETQLVVEINVICQHFVSHYNTYTDTALMPR